MKTSLFIVFGGPWQLWTMACFTFSLCTLNIQSTILLHSKTPLIPLYHLCFHILITFRLYNTTSKMDAHQIHQLFQALQKLLILFTFFWDCLQISNANNLNPKILNINVIDFIIKWNAYYRKKCLVAFLLPTVALLAINQLSLNPKLVGGVFNLWCSSLLLFNFPSIGYRSITHTQNRNEIKSRRTR